LSSALGSVVVRVRMLNTRSGCWALDASTVPLLTPATRHQRKSDIQVIMGHNPCAGGWRINCQSQFVAFQASLWPSAAARGGVGPMGPGGVHIPDHVFGRSWTWTTPAATYFAAVTMVLAEIGHGHDHRPSDGGAQPHKQRVGEGSGIAPEGLRPRLRSGRCHRRHNASAMIVSGRLRPGLRSDRCHRRHNASAVIAPRRVGARHPPGGTYGSAIMPCRAGGSAPNGPHDSLRSTPPRRTIASDRRRGYRKAMHRHGLETGPARSSAR
jgi:hypothetical protein